MKAAERKCRVLWQQIVTLRDGRCLRCGHVCLEGGEMQNVGHHVFGRNKMGSAFDRVPASRFARTVINGSEEPVMGAQSAAAARIGEERYTHLDFLSKQVVRLRPKDYSAIAESLKRSWKG